MAILTALVAAACLEDLPRPSKLEGLRVIGIAADPPEAAAGLTVSLTALVVDTQDRPITLEWYACTIPERGLGFFAGGAETGTSGGRGYGLDDPGDCAAPETIASGASIKLGEGPAVTLDIPADYLAEDKIKEVYGIPPDTEVPAWALQGFLSIAGLNMTVTLLARVDGDSVTAYKRVNVSLANPRNENPTGFWFTLAQKGTAPPADTGPPSSGKCLSGTPTLSKGPNVLTLHGLPSPPEEYSVIVPGSIDSPLEIVTNEEVWFFSFFSSEGRFKEDIIKSTEKSPQSWTFKQAPTAPVDLWIVARDGRGGTTWCHEQIPPGASE